MPKDETLRPFCLAFNALIAIWLALRTDTDLIRWLAVGVAMFSAVAAGWFFREVWQARQSSRNSPPAMPGTLHSK